MTTLNKKIPKRFENAKWDDVAPEIKSLVENIRQTRRGIYLYGPSGVGKTHVTYAIKNYLEEREQIKIPVWVENTTNLLQSIKVDFDRAPQDREWMADRMINYSGIVVIDDLGAEKVTDWVKETLYMIINNRYEEMRPVIVTSNLTLDELSTQLGDRIPSRLAGMCDIIEIKGSDRRTVS